MVLIHPKVLHGGPANTSARPRRNVVLQAGAADAPLVMAPRAGGRRGPQGGAAVLPREC